ncbi:hypothetical protein PPL_05745 [Heterostelium album PN500]|uniref:EGF-like domain-containing protein n=1 Tax=Heterostelium pallidum (strain ATCC 26659 / Pp 5 / PN500) TaxID=670386 RepID=D3BB14_HETP5|nr:hypothetical protein PPL_05745 [Heterostelium album PN500]EFA81751.1 hypothetical protein PPL_05745 [Heterostelium album PN500]|eukprot:XP_020433868.1 hypothetical protein PPL_05745 [Heterostelium album PN500]
MNKSIYLIFIIFVVIGEVIGQVSPPFFEQNRVFNLNYGVDKFKQVQTTKNGATFFNSRQAITFNIPPNSNTVNTSIPLVGNVFNITSSKETFYTSTSINDLVYAFGKNTIYLLDPSQNILATAAHTFSSIKNSFTYGSNIYFIVTSPSNQFVYFNHDNSFLQNNTVFTPTYQYINMTGSLTFWSTSIALGIDQSKGLVFLGDYNGNIASFNLKTNTQLNTFTNTTVSNRLTAAVNTDKNLIYFICGSFSITMDVFSYSNISVGSLIPVGTYKITNFGGSLQGGYDSSIGEVFFTGNEKNQYGLALLAIGSNGNNQSYLDFNSSSSSIETSSIGLQVGSQFLTIYTGDEVIQVSYDTGCPLDCNNRGNCFSGTCNCNEGYSGNSCELKLCTSLNNCSGHGTCNTTNGTCNCQGLWMGNPSCSELSCYMNCYNHGSCNTTDLTCTCDSGYNGVHCQYTTNTTTTTTTSTSTTGVPTTTSTTSTTTTGGDTTSSTTTTTGTTTATTGMSANSTGVITTEEQTTSPSITTTGDNSSTKISINYILIFVLSLICLFSSNPNDLINLLS